ncbi:hypothetical protein NP233_g13087 [Leucocoprinus birnbaumii]|uniref:PHD-type domain-containing protein n=1 Tax=Leucocoprinus birnbaumii TaxID=56174 RepID=A0AAD5VDI2_9AGAR|nr:hypothetical protein NP233_g13087 [Leucocoprinus birnbaumii]
MSKEFPNAKSRETFPTASTRRPFVSSNLAGNANGAEGGALTNGSAGHQSGDHTHSVSGTPDASDKPLAGPGVVPKGFARSASVHSNATNANGTSTAGRGPVDIEALEAAEADADNDETTYCFCNRISYGEMIACDDNNCEIEWFHLSCTGLTVPPDGTWYCETCKNRRNTKRGGRGGKRRAAGNRVGAKA